jgi:PPM family protein phosphatase
MNALGGALMPRIPRIPRMPRDRGRAMGLLTIGAFARASGLTAKALRRYDELGLVRPVRVDPFSGYRYYEPAQVDRARLVAWLRRIGMPLERVGAVCDLCAVDPAAAGRAIRSYWTRVETETAARRDLAAFLVDRLTAAPDGAAGKGAALMSTAHQRTASPTLGIRYASRTDRGAVRTSNQDSVYAGERLLAVADGYGADGATAGAAAIGALATARVGDHLSGADLLNALAATTADANRAVSAVADSGTTLTALLWTGSRLAVVHIGDSRAYLLRDGEFFRITHDHTVVQAMVDEGRLDPAEATSHPQRALLVRALTGGAEGERPDMHLQDARAGDRYLLCSDGLSATVPDEQIQAAVERPRTEPEQVVADLIALCHEGGAPDNIACVVADVIALP